MTKALKLIIVDDSEFDAKVEARILQSGGFAPNWRRLDTGTALRQALAETVPDVLLCDNQMPAFDPLSALAVLREAGLDVPAILVTGTLGEEQAVDFMKAGFDDVVLKGNLSRLSPCVERALQAAEARRARRQAEAELRLREAQLSQAQRIGRLGHWRFDVENDSYESSDVVLEIFGLPADAKMSTGVVDAFIHEDDLGQVQAARRRAVEERCGYDYAYRIRRRGGEMRFIEGRASPTFDAGGRLTGFFGITQDVTERKQAEAALRERDARLRGILENVANGIITIDEQGGIESCNPAAARMFGYGESEMIGTRVNRLMGVADAERLEGYLQRFLEAGHGGIAGIGPVQVSARRQDGASFPVEFSLSEMRLGDRRVFIGVCVDLSERKKIEQQLQQAQKMEAIGNLTGGIAHDFNNILGVVLGNVQMLARALKAEPRHARELRLAERAERAIQRGAALTSRLLAFARRQVLEPSIVDANKLTRGMDDMLRRALSENIEIEFAFGENLWLTRVDPAQFETAILNLAVNARDAMPGGGRLIIETANVRLDEDYAFGHPEAQPGQYVMLAVADSGSGIPPENLAQVFEPFFTTKEVGKGTGLGLAMVYGFIKQSGGHVAISSEVAKGTTVRLYLPRETAAESAEESPGEAEFPRGSETVLLVENDPALRETTTDLLRDLGYTVLQAEDAPAARAILEGDERIDLMLTDMVMRGGISGGELMRVAERLQPRMAVLLSSGHPDSGAVDAGAVEEDVQWLSKPYDLATFARKLRAALDR